MNTSPNEPIKNIPQNLFSQENLHTIDILKTNHEEISPSEKFGNDEKEDPKSNKMIIIRAEMTMKITDNIRQPHYKGPKDKIIQDLFEDVLIMEGIKDRNNPINLFLTKIKLYNARINQWFIDHCTFFRGLITIDKDTLLLWIINLMIQLIFFVLYLNVNFTSNDDTKKAIYDFLPTFSWVFTIYGLILLLIKTKPMIIIIIIQIIVPVFLILNELNVYFFLVNFPIQSTYIYKILVEGSNNKSNASSLIIKFGVIILAVFWGMIYILHRAIVRLFTRLHGNISTMLICGFFCFWMIGLTLLTYLEDNSLSLSQNYIQKNADNFLIFIYILIILSWLIIHFRYFRIPFNEMRITIEKHGNYLIRKDILDTDYINNNNNNSEIVQYISRYMYLFSSILIGGTYIGIEIFLINMLYNAIFDNNSKLTLTLAFTILAIPIFLFSWIAFVMSTFHKKNKFLIIPLIIAMMLFILFPVAKKIQSYDNNNTWLIEYLIFGPPSAIIFIMIFSFCGMKLRRKYYIWSTIICLGGLFPIGICYFLIQSGLMDTTKNIILYIMMGISIGIAILIILPFLFELFKSCGNILSFANRYKSSIIQQLDQLQNENNESNEELVNNDGNYIKKIMKNNLNFMKKIFLKISNQNLKDLGYFLNTILFMPSFVFFVYTGYNRPSSLTNVRLGMVLGIIIMLPIIFILNNIFIRLKTSKVSEDEEQALSNKILVAINQNEDINIKRLKFITKFQKMLMVIGFIIVPLVFLPLIFIFTDDVIQTCFMVLLVLGFILSLLSIIVLEVKKLSRKNHKFIVPLLVLLLWFWLYLPFMVILPGISCYLDVESDKFKSFLSGSMSAAAISFMIGVTLLGLVTVSFLERMQLEKKIVFVIYYVKNKLAEYSVYSEIKELRILYIDYVGKDHTQLKNLLIQDHKPVTWFTIPIDSTKYAGFHKILCTHEVKKALIKAQAKKNDQLTKKKSGCCSKIWGWFFESSKKEDMLILPENMEDDNNFIMDYYMPDDMGENYLLPKNILQLLGLTEEKGLKAPEDIDKVKTINEKLTDHMTKILKELKISKPKQLKNYENIHNDYLLLIKKDQKAYEDWIFSIYEYFSGNFGKYKRDDSPNHGLIYQNYKHFLNLVLDATYQSFICRLLKIFLIQQKLQATLAPNPKLTRDIIKYLYLYHANQKYDNHYVLSFQDFKQILIFYSEKLYKKDKKTSSDYNNIDFKDETPVIYIYISINFVPNFEKFFKKFELMLLNQIFDQPNHYISWSILIKSLQSYSQYQSTIHKAFFLVKNTHRFSNINLLYYYSPPYLFPKKQFEALTTQIYASLMTNIPDVVYTHLLYNINATNGYRLSLNEHKSNDNLKEIDLDYQSTPIGANTNSIDNINLIKNIQQEQSKKIFVFIARFNQDTTETYGPDQIKSPHFTNGSANALLKKGMKNQDKNQEKAIPANILKENNNRKKGYFQRFLDSINSSIKKLQSFLGFSVKKKNGPNNDEIVFRKVAPSWPTTVDIMFNAFRDAEKIYEGIDGVDQKFILNFSNILQLWARLADTFAFISPVFRDQIPWGYEWFGDSSLTNGDESSAIKWYKSFTLLFWMGFGLSIIYPFVAFPSFNLAKKGKLGYDEARSTVAKFPHGQFLLVSFVTLLGNSLFNQIIQWQIIAFPCNFTSYPWTMLQEKDIICLSEKHAFYIILGLLGLMIYYPISTFMYPILNYESRGKTWKYEGSFLVLYVQCKLIVAITTYFFAGENSYDYLTILIQLGSTIFLMILFTIITIISKPCMIKKINTFDALSFMIAAWINICGVVMVVIRNSIISFILLAVGIIGIMIIILRMHFKRYSTIKPIQQHYIIYDDAKERADNPFYSEELIREQKIEEQKKQEKKEIFHDI